MSTDDAVTIADPADWLVRTAVALVDLIDRGHATHDAAAEALAFLGMVEADMLMGPVVTRDVAGGLVFLWPGSERGVYCRVLSRSRASLTVCRRGESDARRECGPLGLRLALADLYPGLKSKWGKGDDSR